MSNNIGLDFGTTYSVISRLKNIQKNENGDIVGYELEACLPNENTASPCQDSVVVKDKDGKLLFGILTRDGVGRKRSVTYRGFKMLLAESSQVILRAGGYDDEHSPRVITEAYLSDILTRYLAMYNSEKKIDKLVIGVPEIWFSDVSTIDCRTILNDIVKNMPFVNEAELVSEPAAACAFLVENYRKSTHCKFEGHVLVIDYGGGTLDIALCKVRENGPHSEVSVVKRCGAGLNEEGYIGKAGLAFIEKIVKIALTPINMTDEEINDNRYFPKCMNSVEAALMGKMGEIAEILAYAEEDESLLNEKFYEIEYGDEDEIIVTYGMLKSAYDEIIRSVLDGKLSEIISYMDDNGIDWSPSNGDKFKIEPAGGFCNFYLTQKQIDAKMGRCVGDKRFENIIDDRRDCEKAISYGAALIANGVIGFMQSSPYHLGIATGSEDEIKDLFFGVHIGDEIIYDKPVFIKNEYNENEIFAGLSIPLFVFSYSDNPYDGFACGEPLVKFKERLTLGEGYYNIGFSFDRSMVITLHLQQVDENDIDKVVDVKKIRLDNIHSLLGGIKRIRRMNGE